MFRKFEIRCSASPSKLSFSGEVPHGLSGYDGYSFRVALEGGALSAFVNVYDIHPQGWSKFFAGLARDWRGWAGERIHESLEGHLRITATSDALGHVSFRVALRDDIGGTNWLAEDTICLEAGQLEAVDKDARLFFG